MRTKSLAAVEGVLSRFFLSHCSSEDNRVCLLGTFCNSGRKGASRSVQATRWARTRNCSRSLNLAPNSIASELPPSTSRANPWEDPKRSPPLVPDTASFEPEKGHWTQLRKVLRHSQANKTFSLGVWLTARKGISRLSPSQRVRRLGSAKVSQSFSEPVVLQTQAYLDPVHRTLTTDLSTDHRPFLHQH